MIFHERRFRKLSGYATKIGFYGRMVVTPRIMKRKPFLPKMGHFLYINTFLIHFAEHYFKSKVVFNLKRGYGKLAITKVGMRRFNRKYLPKRFKTSTRLLHIIYYSLLLKDSSIFIYFFRGIMESIEIKLHKKLLIGFIKIIKDLYKPIFVRLQVLGIFLNLKGKIGVSGNSKKRRRYLYSGRHSITSRSLKADLKFLPV
jgi:hypothetical protein